MLIKICEDAVTAYLKGGDVQSAVECCVHLNQVNFIIIILKNMFTNTNM